MIEPGGSRSSRNAIVARATSAGSVPSRAASSSGTRTRQLWLAPPTVAPTSNSSSPTARALISGMHGMLTPTARRRPRAVDDGLRRGRRRWRGRHALSPACWSWRDAPRSGGGAHDQLGLEDDAHADGLAGELG